MNHCELVKLARVWLENRKNCRVTAVELATSVSETPDAIGWDNGGACFVVEAKVSRSDFLANKHKCHERSGDAMGDERWFIAPKGMIRHDELGDWGLIEVRELYEGSSKYQARKKIDANRRTPTETSRRYEKTLLVSALWRCLRGFQMIKPFGRKGEDEFGDFCEMKARLK